MASIHIHALLSLPCDIQLPPKTIFQVDFNIKWLVFVFLFLLSKQQTKPVLTEKTTRNYSQYSHVTLLSQTSCVMSLPFC